MESLILLVAYIVVAVFSTATMVYAMRLGNEKARIALEKKGLVKCRVTKKSGGYERGYVHYALIEDFRSGRGINSIEVITTKGKSIFIGSNNISKMEVF